MDIQTESRIFLTTKTPFRFFFSCSVHNVLFHSYFINGLLLHKYWTNLLSHSTCVVVLTLWVRSIHHSAFRTIILLIAISFRIPRMGKASHFEDFISVWAKHGYTSFHKYVITINLPCFSRSLPKGKFLSTVVLTLATCFKVR